MLEENGVDPVRKPDMKSFYFVQIDEFYPINTKQHNSFYYYVNKFYIKGFGLDPKKALLINPNISVSHPDQTIKYRIKRGDSPYLIAKRYRMNLADFLKLNMSYY